MRFLAIAQNGRRLLASSLVILLAATSLVVASCNLVQTSTTKTSSAICNGQQVNHGQGCTPTTSASSTRRLLVFSKTGGFRHSSIKDGKIALQKLATEHNFRVDFTEDSSIFTDANLSHYNAVIFLMTTGSNILDTDQKAAFERYIRAGGGYVGVHSASDTEYGWSWYGGLVGAYFDRIHGHSKVMQATIHVTDRTHPSTMMLPSLWIRTDEWYNFATNPRGRVNILLTLDEKTYKGGTMGADHPIAWYHEYDGGRAWYTAMGHTSQSYYEPLFLDHLWGGIIYAAGTMQRVGALSQVVGLLFSASGLGTLIGALSIASLGDFKYKGVIVLTGLFCWTGSLLVFAVSRSLWLSILALVLFGISQNWVGATVITLLIMGVRHPGDFPAGALIALIGGPYTVIISATIVGSYSLYLLIGRPVIRTLEQ